MNLLFELQDESSMLYWYDGIQDLLPVPKTVICELSGQESDLVSHMIISDAIINRIHDCANKIGYPLFLRTDHTSGKHCWLDTCYVKDESNLIRNVRELLGESAISGPLGLPVGALVFREYLNLESGFKAFNYMPIAKERRYFVRDGVVECHHPYWPEPAIRGWGDCELVPDWKNRLAIINHESPAEIRMLSKLAKLWPYPGYWSVDFAQDVNGKWWCIDAAKGELSCHLPDCPYKNNEVVINNG